MDGLGKMLSDVHGRKFIYQFAISMLGENICEEIDTRGKPYPELTRVALMLKQKLMEHHYDNYKTMKMEAEKNEW